METASNVWFNTMDAQFHLRNVTTEETRFFPVLAALPAEAVARIPNAIPTWKQLLFPCMKVQMRKCLRS